MNSAYNEAINLVPYTNARGIPIKTKNGDMQFIQQANKKEKIKPYPEIIDLELYNGPNKQKFIKNKKFPMATKGSITIDKKDNSGRITRKMPVVKKARAVKKAPAKAPAVKKAQAPVQAAAVKKAPAVVKAPAPKAQTEAQTTAPVPAQPAAAYNLASPATAEYNLASPSPAAGPDYDLAKSTEEQFDVPSFVPESPYDNLVPGQKLEVKGPPNVNVGGRRKTKRNKKKTKRNKKKTKRNKKKTKRNYK